LGQDFNNRHFGCFDTRIYQKRSKVPYNEIQKAVNIRTKYLLEKQEKDKKK